MQILYFLQALTSRIPLSIDVSFSALECFEQCSEKYRLRYRERLTSEKIASPLFFGTAIDAAVELFLLKRKVNLTEKELDLLLYEDAYSMFDKTMREQNGVLLERNPLCEYFYSDFDPNILLPEDFKALTKAYPSISDWEEFFAYCKKYIKTHGELTQGTKIAFNNLCWLSLYRKGEMMLKAYERDILPEIQEVFNIQKEVQLLNESGDKLRGKIDFIASFKDDPSVRHIVDNKTSSEPYKSDSVANSVQLAIYCEAETCNRAAYVVMEKKMRIKEPRARTQIVKDTITEEHKQKTFDIVEQKLNNIACGNFSKKDSPKECHFFGKPCEFFNLCWHGKMDGLKKRN
jgi:hypothetical protein